MTLPPTHLLCPCGSGHWCTCTILDPHGWIGYRCPRHGMHRMEQLRDGRLVEVPMNDPRDVTWRDCAPSGRVVA